MSNTNTTWTSKKASLMTQWAEKLDSHSPLPEYPRPQWQRKLWASLNGLWNYAIQPKKAIFPTRYDGQILVPFAVESALSGVMKSLKPSQRLWYQRKFTLPDAWAKESDSLIILHFGAVDFEATVWINGQELISHKGGYTPFSVDITEGIKGKSENEIIVAVWDPTDKGRQERGKQVLVPFGINYTPISGIWQTVWLECVSKCHIDSAKFVPNIDSAELSIELKYVNLQAGDQIHIEVKDGEKSVQNYQGNPQEKIILKIPSPKLWTPDQPFLYDLFFSVKRNGKVIDSVSSYFGMRKISLGKDDQGIVRLQLNNNSLFQYGLLDQGYWPDGLYTAPTEEALRFDIEMQKSMGLNMIRKHIKVEPARWYYWCDKIGMLVWQDMPSGGSQYAGVLTNFVFKQKIKITYGRGSKAVQDQYYAELKAMVETLYNVPSIIMWVPFNEGWGQFETPKAVNLIRELDSSRLINNASGWTDAKVGDVHDIHVYPTPGIPPLESERAVVCGEFGGLGYRVPDHQWAIKLIWGYKKFPSKEILQTKYGELMEKLKTLIKQGLSAAVYTQITDVEGEANGLLSYDRAVEKIPIDWLKNLHLDLYKI